MLSMICCCKFQQMVHSLSISRDTLCREKLHDLYCLVHLVSGQFPLFHRFFFLLLCRWYSAECYPLLLPVSRWQSVCLPSSEGRPSNRSFPSLGGAVRQKRNKGSSLPSSLPPRQPRAHFQGRFLPNQRCFPPFMGLKAALFSLRKKRKINCEQGSEPSRNEKINNCPPLPFKSKRNLDRSFDRTNRAPYFPFFIYPLPLLILLACT